MPPCRVLVAHPDDTVLTALARFVAACDGAEVVGRASTADELAGRAADGRPQVAVVGLPVWRPDVAAAVRRVKWDLPECHVAAVADEDDAAYRALAWAAGADELIGQSDLADRLRALFAACPHGGPA